MGVRMAPELRRKDQDKNVRVPSLSARKTKVVGCEIVAKWPWWVVTDVFFYLDTILIKVVEKLSF